jgi:neutral ceramidase
MRARAGAAAADITPPVGVRMAGYGRRTTPATGIIDPLLVRALVLSDGSSEIAIAVCDLLGVGSDVVTSSRALIEERVGIPAARVLVAATHTHAGPSGFRASEDPGYTDVLARHVAGAVAMARTRLEPVTVKLGTVDVATISQNRRDPVGPVQTAAHVLLADTEAPGPPVATLVNFACHATVLEHDNLRYSPDFPGAMARMVESCLGGTAVYLQGACGDVNPVWSRHDAGEVERVGGVLGGAAVRLAQEMRPLGAGQWCINLSWSEDVEVPCPGRLLAPLSLAGARTELELPRRPRRTVDEVDAELRGMEARLAALPAGDLGGRRALRARINDLATARLFPPLPSGRATQRLEVQALRLSEECAVVTLPGEFFAETGAELARRCGLPCLLVAGYANGSVGYVPPARAFPEGGYEVGMTQFGPEAEAAIVDAAVETVGSLYR